MLRYSPFQLPIPEPVAGCGACAELAAERAYHREQRDMTRVTDYNVYMRRHLSQAHQEAPQQRRTA